MMYGEHGFGFFGGMPDAFPRAEVSVRVPSSGTRREEAAWRVPRNDEQRGARRRHACNRPAIGEVSGI